MFVKYTLIDNATKKPLSVEPARAGATKPDWAEEIFYVESSFSTGIPIFYGKVVGEKEDWAEEVSEEDVISLYRNELTHLTDILFARRKESHSHHSLKDFLLLHYNTIPDGILLEYIHNGEWVVSSKEEIKSILDEIGETERDSLTWYKEKTSLLKEAESIEDLKSFRKSLYEAP